SFVVVTEAWLSTGELSPVASVVGETMCTEKKPGARSVGPQSSEPALIEQPWSGPSIDQTRPASVGSKSCTDTFRAVPVPLLVTVIVKPIWSPDETDASSA